MTKLDVETLEAVKNKLAFFNGQPATASQLEGWLDHEIKLGKMKYKQVIIVRTDMKMSPGRIAAEVAHASLSAYVGMVKRDFETKAIAEAWGEEGYRRAVLAVPHDLALLELSERVRTSEDPLPYFLVKDGSTLVALAIGPALAKSIDKLTRELSTL